MRHVLTPASQRAVDFASGWTLGNDGIEWTELSAPALLLGLLSEAECRAAMMLARRGIDADAVQRRWPALATIGPAGRGKSDAVRLSEEVQLSLQLAEQRLAHLPQPLELATEHILLGLVVGNCETALWLHEQGFDPDALNSVIQMKHGHVGAPIELYAEAKTAARGEQAGDQVLEAVIESSDVPVLRVLDAAANRAREGLRVVEDYVRFILDDVHLTGLCKEMRHDLTAALAALPEPQRLAARETQRDVGTELTIASERLREDAASVLSANFARLQEAFRSIEEFGKVVDVDLADACKQLRYRVYTLQRAVEVTRRGIERLAGTRLYVLIDGCSSVDEFRRLASSLIEAGVDVIQLRDKLLGDRELLDRARLLRALTAESETLMVVNDRPDLAALANADGVHVGRDDVSVKDARTIVGSDALVGASTHDIEQARQAVLDGADYIGVGPTFPSGTKQFERFPGVDLLRTVAAEIRLPSFAIGGIDRDNLDQVLAAGIARIAVSGTITGADDPAAAARELLARLSRS